eukprot:755776-Hanusia_phi.AAC.2
MARALQVEVIKKCHEGVYKALTEGTQEAIQAAIDSFLGGALLCLFLTMSPDQTSVRRARRAADQQVCVLGRLCRVGLCHRPESQGPRGGSALAACASASDTTSRQALLSSRSVIFVLLLIVLVQNHSGAIDALLDELKLNDKLDKIEALTDIVTSDGQSKVEEDRDEDSWFSSSALAPSCLIASPLTAAQDFE